MSLLNNLIKQLQGGVAQVNPFDGGADYQSVTRPQPVAPRRQAIDPRMNPRDPASQGYAPEITYNPNPNTNLPYSSHSMEDALLGNEYVKNPRDPKFIGVDPARFGFPADDTVRPIEVKYPRVNPQTGYYKAGPQQLEAFNPMSAFPEVPNRIKRF
jgi:hypothetical protein